MTYMLAKLLRDDGVVIKVDGGDTWKVWFPLEKLIQVEEINEGMRYFSFEFREF